MKPNEHDSNPEMNPKHNVTIYGAKTLENYTAGILVQGFKENSLSGNKLDTEAIIYQMHGAPQAEKEDRAFLKRIGQEISKEDGVKRVVLLHRPDEIQLRHPELKDILASATHPVGLVFLGDMHIDDEFFQATNIVRRVIPHGFFENISTKLQSEPIVVGSHTTWGEMRSIEHIFKLLGEVYRMKDDQFVVGYVGGKPQDQLQADFLKEQWVKQNPDVPVDFVNGHERGELETKQGRNIILFDSTNTMPDGIGLTFNVQLYYLNGKVRTGESSGSVHSSVSVPVVLEMNGSEAIEDLKVIKIPYGSRDDIATVDFKAGAGLILASIANGGYEAMFNHNLAQSKKFNPVYIAREYIKLFNQLS